MTERTGLWTASGAAPSRRHVLRLLGAAALGGAAYPLIAATRVAGAPATPAAGTVPVPPAPAVGDMKAPVEINRATIRLEEQLVCQCGCTMRVSVCDCGTADGVRKDLAARMTAGESDDAILAAYVAKYGEQVLAAPTKRGFNWTAWITPFAALFAGGALLWVLVRRWVQVGRAHVEDEGEAVPLTAAEDAAYRKRMAELLRDRY